MRLLRRHRLFAVVFSLAVALRILVSVGYSVVWFEDSFDYVGVAQRMQPYPVRPSGYSFLLWLLEPLQSFAAVTAVQHLLGLAMGLMVYALVRRRAAGSRPVWAVLAASPVLLDAYQIFFEHTVLSDVLFSFLVVAAVTILLWTPRPSLRMLAAAGLLLAAAVLTRSIGLALLPLFAGYLLVGRAGRRALVVAALATTLPLGGYAAWYASWHGSPALNGGSGVWLWARTMPFADCELLRPPVHEAVLCPAQPVHQRPSSPHFIWSDWSPLRQVPGHPIATHADLFHPRLDGPAGDLARRAILNQPLGYLRTVVRDLGQMRNWRRGPTPDSAPITYNRYAFPNVEGSVPDGVRIPGGTIRQDLSEYESGSANTRLNEPVAAFIRAYQTFVFVPGTLLSAFAVAVSGVYLVSCAKRRGGRTIREAALPLAAALALIIGPVVITTYDSRYGLPAIPLLCVALAVSMSGRSENRGNEAPMPERRGLTP
jgi:hypothetical protein